MTLHGMDLILIVGLIALGLITSYWLLLRSLRRNVSERQLKVADQLAALDDAIRALETRLAEHQQAPAKNDAPINVESAASGPNGAQEADSSEPIDSEIKAVIAAAAMTAMGQNAKIKSISAAHPTTSPWTQQGRVLVQSSHNLRARR